jgi:hypothetical protein
MTKSSFATACSEVVPAMFACGEFTVEGKSKEFLRSAINEDQTRPCPPLLDHHGEMRNRRRGSCRRRQVQASDKEEGGVASHDTSTPSLHRDIFPRHSAAISVCTGQLFISIEYPWDDYRTRCSSFEMEFFYTFGRSSRAAAVSLHFVGTVD